MYKPIKRIKTLKIINPLTISLLIYLMESIPNNLSSTRARLAKRIKTSKEILGTIKDEYKVIAITFLYKVLISSKKKKKIFFISNVLTTK